MTEDTVTIETVKAELAAKLATAQAEVRELAIKVTAAEEAVGKAAIAHAKNPNLPALLEVTGKHTKADDDLACATAAAGRFEAKLANIEKDAQREADRTTAATIVTKGEEMLAMAVTIGKMPKGVTMSGTMTLAALGRLNAEQTAVCQRHSVTSLPVRVYADDKGIMTLAVGPFFGKAKRVSSGGGGGNGRAKNYSDGSESGNARLFAEKYKPESAAKIAASIAEGKSASYAHIAAGLVSAGTITEA